MTANKRTLYRSAKWLQEVNEPDDEVVESATTEESPEASATSQESPELTPEEKSYKNRYDSLKAHYDKMLNENRQAIATLQEQVRKSTSTAIEAPVNEEELKEWRTAYPELYKVVKMISRLEANETTKTLQDKLEQVEVQSQSAKREKAEAVLLRLHPDFPDLANSQEFRDWLDDQPPVIQGWLYDNNDDPLLAGKAISMYKLEKGIGQKKKTKSDDASLAVTKTGTGAQPSPDNKKKEWRASEVNKLSPKQYEKLEDEIDSAIAEGRFINDM